MRREVEAAEASEGTAAKKKAKKKAVKKKAVKKKSTATRTRKKKADVPVRRRLVWVVYSSTMREEGRYLYHERDQADEKLNALLAKGKRRYFIQPIKEPLDSEGNPLVPDGEEKLKKGELPGDVSVPAEKPEVDAEADADGDVPEADAEVDPDVEVDDDAATDE